jgi:ankyrin repeat protein
MRLNALHLAARNGREAIARQLFSFNSSIINSRNGIYFTPLDLIATRGFKGPVQLLISMGTDLRAQDLGGGTALYRAVEEGQAAVVKLRVEMELDIIRTNIHETRP